MFDGTVGSTSTLPLSTLPPEGAEPRTHENQPSDSADAGRLPVVVSMKTGRSPGAEDGQVTALRSGICQHINDGGRR